MSSAFVITEEDIDNAFDSLLREGIDNLDEPRRDELARFKDKYPKFANAFDNLASDYEAGAEDTELENQYNRIKNAIDRSSIPESESGGFISALRIAFPEIKGPGDRREAEIEAARAASEEEAERARAEAEETERKRLEAEQKQKDDALLGKFEEKVKILEWPDPSAVSTRSFSVLGGDKVTSSGGEDVKTKADAFIKSQTRYIQMLVSVRQLQGEDISGDKDRILKFINILEMSISTPGDEPVKSLKKAKDDFEKVSKKLEQLKELAINTRAVPAATAFLENIDDALADAFKEIDSWPKLEVPEPPEPPLEEGMLHSITIDFSEIRRKQKHLDESFLMMFGSWVKWLLEKMFGTGSIPGTVKGTKREVESFARAMGSEKRYIETAKRYGLAHPTTYKNKAKLSTAAKAFEKETGIKWPFE
jgi:hypothetical protein